MTKREFAEQVAEIVNGTVNEVEKTNGVKKLGICRKQEKGATPNVYIDEMFGMGFTVDKAAQEVMKLFNENSSIDFDENSITVWENVKAKIKVRLFNNKTNVEVFKSAKEYGFDDLIITPYVQIDGFANGVGTIKIGNSMLEMWGVSVDEVINIGIENSKADGYRIQSMYEIMVEMVGAEQAAMMGIVDDDGRMYVLSNENKMFGAIGVILLADELKEKFPSGYVVIPSSVHEVIVVPRDIMDEEDMNSMVNEVNGSEVALEEVLGSKVYIF